VYVMSREEALKLSAMLREMAETEMGRFIADRDQCLVHYLAFPIWAAATFHGLGAGTDSSSGWVFVAYLTAIAAVAALAAWRLARPLAGPGAPRLAPAPGEVENAVFSATPGEVGHELE
jgi:hypothetical protein